MSQWQYFGAVVLFLMIFVFLRFRQLMAIADDVDQTIKVRRFLRRQYALLCVVVICLFILIL